MPPKRRFSDLSDNSDYDRPDNWELSDDSGPSRSTPVYVPSGKAKTKYCLSDKDLAPLKIEETRNPISRYSAPTKLYRIVDLECVAYAKWGGLTGLRSEKAKRGARKRVSREKREAKKRAEQEDKEKVRGVIRLELEKARRDRSVCAI